MARCATIRCSTSACRSSRCFAPDNPGPGTPPGQSPGRSAAQKGFMKIAVIGGGAAGYFAAIHASGPGIQVLLFEKSPKVLSKVKISGGGRCNVTHRPLEISKLVKNYPRGEKFLKRGFAHFSIEDTFSWFESRGVPLKIDPFYSTPSFSV